MKWHTTEAANSGETLYCESNPICHYDYVDLVMGYTGTSDAEFTMVEDKITAVCATLDGNCCYGECADDVMKTTQVCNLLRYSTKWFEAVTLVLLLGMSVFIILASQDDEFGPILLTHITSTPKKRTGKQVKTRKVYH